MGRDLYNGVEKQSFAYGMLEKLGWSEGQGLGKDGKGIKSYVRARRHVEQYGVGRLQADQKAADWTVNTSSFDQILSNLRAHHGADDAAGASPSAAAELEDGKTSRGSRDEERPRKKQKKQKKLVRAQGRYTKKERSKLVSRYSSEDLAAILGETGPAADGPTPARTAGDDAQGGSRSKVVVVVKVPPVSSELVSYKPSPLGESWWGHASFTRSATLLGESTRERKPEDGGKPFTKGQEEIYDEAQSKVTQNRQGLGMASREIKIAGGNWCGKKVSLGDENDGEDDGSGSGSDRSTDERVDLSDDLPRSGDPQEAGAAASGRLSRSSIKALVVDVLKKRGKAIKASKLKSKVFKLARCQETAKHVDKFYMVLQQTSRKFAYDGKRVKLL